MRYTVEDERPVGLVPGRRRKCQHPEMMGVRLKAELGCFSSVMYISNGGSGQSLRFYYK